MKSHYKLRSNLKGVGLFVLVGVIAISAILSLISSDQTKAAINDWTPGRIIDDAVFTNNSSMTTAQIQQFLNSKVASCDTWGTRTSEYGGGTRRQWAESRGYSAPFTCLKDYTQDGRSAAQIIYDVSQEFTINPQVLIVLLQKEQGLVTDTWPLSLQYRSATGYGCPDTAPCDSQYYGLVNQLTWAARMFRAIMNNSPTWYTPKTLGNNYIQWSPTSSCGGSVVNIENRSTQALYNYTPYQPNQAALNTDYGTGDGCSAYGNRNFYVYFRDWFGSTKQSSLVRTPSSSTYYLLSNGTRFAIPSGDILYAYGLEGVNVTVVSDAYLNTVPNGGMLSTLFTIPGDNTVYLADGGNRYGIPSGEYCVRWGLQCGNAEHQKTLGLEIYNKMPNLGALQPIMRFGEAYYLMVNGTKQHFITPQAMAERGYSAAGSITVRNWTNAIRPFGISLPENNSFIKFATGSGIYLYSGNNFYAAPDMGTFGAWNGSKNSYLDSDSSYNAAPPAVTATLRNFYTQGGKLYQLSASHRQELTGATASPENISLDTHTSLQAITNTRITSAIDSSKAVAPPGGAIYGISGGQLRPIADMQDLWLNYTESNIISVNNGITSAYQTGKILTTPGRVIKPNETSAMYIYGSDGNLWALGSLGELASALTWRNTTVNASFSNIEYGVIKVYSGIVKVSGIYYAVGTNGNLRALPAPAIINEERVTPIDGPLGTAIRKAPPTSLFIRFDNGAIFQVNSSEINPISTVSRYLSLGGNAGNTVSMPLKSLNAFQVGALR